MLRRPAGFFTPSNRRDSFRSLFRVAGGPRPGPCLVLLIASTDFLCTEYQANVKAWINTP
jgi:hypothetical protein